MSGNHDCNCHLFVFYLQSKYAAFEACKMKHVQRSSKTPRVQIRKWLQISSKIPKLASSVKLGMWQVLVGPWRRPSQVDGSPFHFQTILLPVLGLRRPPLHHLVIQVMIILMMIILMMIVLSTWSPSTCTLPTPPALVTCQSCCCCWFYTEAVLLTVTFTGFLVFTRAFDLWVILMILVKYQMISKPYNHWLTPHAKSEL